MGLTTACLYKFGTVPVESEVLIILTTIGAKRSIILKNKEVGNISNGHDDGFIFLSKTMTSSNETAENLVQEQFGVATTMVLSSDGFTLALISFTLFTKYFKNLLQSSVVKTGTNGVEGETIF